jgi:hypothetical protein
LCGHGRGCSGDARSRRAARECSSRGRNPLCAVIVGGAETIDDAREPPILDARALSSGRDCVSLFEHAA